MAYPAQNTAMSPSQNPPNYPPFQGSTSPAGNASPYAPPPAKRPRLSPDPRSPQNGAGNFVQSPQGTPGIGNYGNPFAPPGAQSPYSPTGYGGSPQSSFNTPQPFQPQQGWSSQPPTPAPAGRQGSPTNANSSQMMPPPPRPNKEEKEEKISADDISDSLYGSGVNLKDEENYMHNMFTNRHTADSFNSNQSTSFGSSTLSPNNSFNLLTQGTSFGSQDQNGAFSGTLGETQSQEQIEQQEKLKRAQDATARNEKLQYHLQHPFLEGNCVRRRLDMRARSEGVLLPTQGLYVRTQEPETRVLTNGEKSEGVVAVRPESLVEQGSQFDHLLSLISLAANERLRGLVDDAYTMARARRYGDHGRVPPEFADVAEGEGKRKEESVVPENITGTQWDKIPESALSPNAAEGKETPQPQSTVSFQGRLNSSLRALAEDDRKAEETRVKRREARRKQAENASASAAEDDALDPSTPNAELSGKLSKKEQAKRDKASKEGAEAQSHSTTNQTAAMMAMGKKTSKYSWMTGGSASMPTNRFAKPNSGTSTPAAVSTKEPATPAEGAAPAGKTEAQIAKKTGLRWGDWREDSESGKGVQVRDLALVLERDGREKRALQRIWNKMR